MSWKLSFLAASDGTPLAKRYALSDDKLEKSSYPNTYHFDSHSESIESLPDLYRAVTDHAAQGHCLLKGELSRPLRHESRRDTAPPLTPTGWVALDFDGVPAIESFDDLIPHLPPYFKNTSYVEQYSASAGVEPDKGYSAHVFMLLEGATPPNQLKEWLTHLNLTIPILRSAIRLNLAGTTLRWPLDLTACQNDKLLYIAPPLLGDGVVDRLEGDRIRHVRRAVATLPVDLSLVDATRNAAKRQELLDGLRAAAKLPARPYKLVPHRTGGTYLETPETVEVTGEKRERGYCYVNINGGNSWGYWHAEDDPEILHNFKGEPNYLLKTFAPAYYARACTLAKGLKEVRKAAKREAAKLEKRKEKAAAIERAEERASKTGVHYLAINVQKADTYYCGIYDASTDTLRDFHPTRSRSKLDDFLKENKQPIPDYVPNWRVDYDFDSDIIFDPENKFINLYKRSEYLRNPVASDTVPPTILRLLQHAFGYNDECVEHFLNWVACIVQRRARTLSAWVLSGTQGTGKGSLFSDVLAPILGKEYTCNIELPALQGDFNGFIEGKLLVLVDESETSELRERRKVMMKLKRLISEHDIQINRKGQNQYMAPNRANFILASNKHDPVEVDSGDRRFNIAPRQEQKILADWGGPMSLEELTTGVRSELRAFAGYLLAYPADAKRASIPIDTEERERLKELTATTAQNIANKLKAGDLEFFVDYWPQNDNTIAFELLTGQTGTPSYGQILEEAFANLDTPIHLPRQHLHMLFTALDEVQHAKPARFTSYIRKLGLDLVNRRLKGDQRRGLPDIVWRASPELVARWEQECAIRASKKPALRRIK